MLATVDEFAKVPNEMKLMPQWVCWDDQGGRKMPIAPTTGQAAKTNDKSTWTDFATACAAYKRLGLTGIGFVFSEDDELVGIDLDACLDSDWDIADWAKIIVEEFATYTEISPSGRGLKLWCKGKIAKGCKHTIEKRDGGKSSAIEVYATGRYFTVTGQQWDDGESVVSNCQEQLDSLTDRYWPRSIKIEPERIDVEMRESCINNSSDSAEIIDRARKYLAKIPPAIDGQNGHTATLLAAEHLVRGFSLSDKDAFGLLSEWNGQNQPPWSDSELQHKIDEARTKGTSIELGTHLSERPSGNSQPGLTLLDLPPDTDDDWPKPLESEALYGLAGEFVSEVLPETEADAAALLMHFLTTAAAMFGREKYFSVSGTQHHARLFSVAVGGTASGRKGTALDCVLHVFQLVDSLTELDELATDESANGNLSGIFAEGKFCDENMVSGLTSGSGLIFAVRDPREVRNNVDPGVSDKRLLVVESELGGVLRICQRKENDLSAVIRDAWDGKTLRTLAKQEPAKATRPHINIIGHVTREELRATLSKVDTANGFANRILWYCAKRSKLLPDGGALHARDFCSLANRIQSAVRFARQPEQMARSEAASKLWHKVYGELTSGRAGVFGNVTTRAEAQTLRLSILYALLDESKIIDVPHLKAALAVWKYCEASARWAFGASLGNPTADELLTALRLVKPNGLTSTEISGLFTRNRNSSQIREACGLLQRCGLARPVTAKRSGPGRPGVSWYAT
jgi:hypothetical protein